MKYKLINQIKKGYNESVVRLYTKSFIFNHNMNAGDLQQKRTMPLIITLHTKKGVPSTGRIEV